MPKTRTHVSVSRFMAELRGEAYKRDRSNDTRRSHGKSGKSGKRLTIFNRAHFIAWDGEGISVPSRPSVVDVKGKVEYQAYALLMNNEGTEVVNVDGLSTEQCFYTLLNSTSDKKAIHVVFGGSYDMNMMLRDLPEESLRLLQKGKAVDYFRFNLKYRPRKCLEIREYRDQDHKFKYNFRLKKYEHDYIKHITLWDVFSFFGESFVSTLYKYFVKGGNTLPLTDKYKLIIEQIEQGKKLRGTFTEEQLHSFVKPYCKLEVDALEELMQTLHKYLKECNITISRWDGAGAVAAGLMKKYNVKPHIAETTIPKEVIRAAEYAFFGGRIETLRFGNYEGTVYHKDISSAYPAELTDIPSFQDADWVNVKHPTISDIDATPPVTLLEISWRMKSERELICPFPWRDHRGNVYFPPYGRGWVYKPELDMACRKFEKYGLQIYVHQMWSMYPSNDHKPFGFIPELFAMRQEFIRNGSGAEKVIKLGINSLYGKTAQSLGYDAATGMKPPYHNLIVAGLTTSGTRAKMMEAAMQHPESVIMLATDGVYSTKDMKVEAPVEKTLGTWEASVHDYITVVASGVYWYGDTTVENAYSRGFDKYSILRQAVIQAWRENKKYIDCETTRFVGLGSAVSLNDFSKWCTWRTVYRKLELYMESVTKRRVTTESNPADGLVSTIAAIPQQLYFEHWAGGYPFTEVTKAGENHAMSTKYHYEWDAKIRVLDGIPMREYLQEVANSKA